MKGTLLKIGCPPQKSSEVQDWRNGKWTRQDWIRFWLHIPVGAACALIAVILPVLGVIACIAFLSYEALEDWRIHDLSFKDILGFAWGFMVVALAACAVVVVLL